ncbi:MAG: hypothetical protein IPG34_10160 [Rhodocyclaceae bacterium]|nr:hypothetical protein [Rhodocyclaceae bacterium]
MPLTTSYSTADLTRILEQSIIYDCACPAQVCKELTGLRALFAYQEKCLNATDTDRAVHQRIALAVREAHALMETCLADVLALEGWNVKDLTMPAELQKRLIDRATNT